MLSYIRGTLERIGDTYIIVECGGLHENLYTDDISDINIVKLINYGDEMKIYEYNENINVDSSHIAGSPSDILYFDIETTGLSAVRSELYMIGLGRFAEHGAVITLIFNDNGTSEPEMLEYFANILSDYNVIVTYNGDTFDLPYIKAKFSQFDISSDIDCMISCDIYKLVRRYKKLLELTSAKQSDVEKLIGASRDEFISGGELIGEYHDYMKTGDSDLRNDLLTHNRDDIRGLIAISEFYALTHIIRDMSITHVENKDDCIEYLCSVPHLPADIAFSDDMMSINIADSHMTVRIKKFYGKKKFFFNDYKNYYYLPLEDTAIHKSMAVYVDSERRVKATKNTAYAYADGEFVIAPNDFSGEIFHDEKPSDTAYIKTNEYITSYGDSSASYLSSVLMSVFN